MNQPTNYGEHLAQQQSQQIVQPNVNVDPNQYDQVPFDSYDQFQQEMVKVAQANDVQVVPIDTTHFDGRMQNTIPMHPDKVKKRRQQLMNTMQQQQQQVQQPAPRMNAQQPLQTGPAHPQPKSQQEVSGPEPYTPDLDFLPYETPVAQEPSPTTQEEEMPEMDPYAILETIPGAPSRAQVEAWKRDYGQDRIRFLFLEAGRAIIFKPIDFFTWKNRILASQGADNLDVRRHLVLEYGLLWPKLDPSQMNMVEAGWPDFVYGVIMNSSYFLPPENAMMAIQRL
jgi:hypothetical protein